MMSIRLRFAIVSVISIAVGLVFASWFMIEIFADNFGRRIDAELTGHINNLAASLEFAPDGALIKPASPADNRFLQAYGGLYWQIDDSARKVEMRSPSLFDYALPLPADIHVPGTIHRYRLKGPEGTDVVVQERMLTMAAPGGPRNLRIAVALDAAVVDEARSSFAWSILPYVAALAVFLAGMSLVQLRIGLRPLDAVARDLDRIRERAADRLPGPYPRELSGLVDQLNRLLASQAQAIEKARRRASDLAHGLKTPLTVISNNAYTLRERGETEMADELDALAGSMLAHVDHELARARIAHSPDLRRSDASPARIADDVIRTLKRTEFGEQLQWSADIPAALMLPIDPHDLRELLGNLLENAGKWARTAVSVSWQDASLVIQDDGPGVAPGKLEDITRRGVRLDDRQPGSGLGLAIVKEIADVYGLRMSLENRAEGGLRATVAFGPSGAA